MWHSSPCKRDIRVCMALKINRNLDNNIPITTHKNYNKVWKSLPGVFCCVFKASQCFQTPFWAVYLSATCPRASLYYVNNKVGNWKSNLNEIWPVIWGERFKNLANICMNLKHSLTCLAICQEGWCAVLSGQLIFGEVHLLRHRPSLKTKFISNRAPFLPPIEPCPWNVMTNSRSKLGTSTKMCPTGEIHGKPLARNKPHTPSPG